MKLVAARTLRRIFFRSPSSGRSATGVNTRTRPVLRFFGKAFLLGLPLLAFILSDPFKVIWNYRFGDYYSEQPWELNRDYVSTEMFLRQQPQERFDTFIFGSSRSFAFHCDELKKHLPDSRPFHYPAASEHLLGIHGKVKFLDREGVKLAHVLIIFDPYLMATTDFRPGHLHRIHPRVSGEGWTQFELACLKASFADLFPIKYIDYKLFGRIRPYMHNVLMVKPGDIKIDPKSNDYYYAAEEQLLESDPEEFYRQREPFFAKVKRPPADPFTYPVAGPEVLRYYREMREVFDRHGTDYRIVISPLYNQVALHPNDLETLHDAFGKDRVYDFTGVNSFTESKYNYYEPEHFRPFIANEMLRRVYAKQPSP